MWRVSDEESAKVRETGNEFFKKKKVKEALKYYDIAQERAESLDCLVKSLTNRALCHIKLGHFEDARFDCQEALRLDPKMSKLTIVWVYVTRQIQISRVQENVSNVH